MLLPLLEFEIFDDVANYYWMLTLLGLAVVPRSLYVAVAFLWGRVAGESTPAPGGADGKEEADEDPDAPPPPDADHVTFDGKPCECDQCTAKKDALRRYREAQTEDASFTLFDIFFVLLVFLFVFLVAKAPQVEGQEMAKFDPYKVLDLPTGEPSLAKIKRQYRRLSLKYHPDKNQDNPDAEAKFIQISKAYQTLTDEATRENYERYGNPDGYKGTSTTIGLPSFLMNKENANMILIVYCACLIALCVAVGVWWATAKKFDESGVMSETLDLYYWRIGETVSFKKLVEMLGCAGENQQLTKLGIKAPTVNALGVLARRIDSEDKTGPRYLSEKLVQKIGGAPWAYEAVVLLHAHLNRMPIPPELADDMQTVIRRAHVILEAMFKAVIQPHFEWTAQGEPVFRESGERAVKPTYMDAALQVLRLSQNITQALPNHSSPLLQLPYMTAKLAHKVRGRSVSRFLAMSEKERTKSFGKILTDAEIEHMMTVARLIPTVDLNVEYEVEGEEDQRVFPNDRVVFHISLKRMHLQAYDDAQAADMADGDEADEGERKVREDEAKARELSAAEVEELSARKKLKDDPLNLEWHSLQKREKPQNKRPGPMVHAPYFPFPKKEVWWVILFDEVENMALGYKSVSTFNKEEEVDFDIMIPEDSPAQRRKYRVEAVCDSYLGCDVSVRVPLVVHCREVIEQEKKEKKRLREEKKKKKGENAGPDEDEEADAQEAERAAESSDEDEESGSSSSSDEEEDGSDGEEEEEEPEPMWYYLYLAADWKEFVFTVVILVLLCVFIFNILYARGYIHRAYYYWDLYGAPVYASVKPFLPSFLTDFLEAVASPTQPATQSDSYYDDEPGHGEL